MTLAKLYELLKTYGAIGTLYHWDVTFSEFKSCMAYTRNKYTNKITINYTEKNAKDYHFPKQIKAIEQIPESIKKKWYEIITSVFPKTAGCFDDYAMVMLSDHTPLSNYVYHVMWRSPRTEPQMCFFVIYFMEKGFNFYEAIYLYKFFESSNLFTFRRPDYTVVPAAQYCLQPHCEQIFDIIREDYQYGSGLYDLFWNKEVNAKLHKLPYEKRMRIKLKFCETYEESKVTLEHLRSKRYLTALSKRMQEGIFTEKARKAWD